MNQTVINTIVLICGLYAVIYVVTALFVSAGERRYRTGDLPLTLPSVSVIVCARNEERDIRRCLESLRCLDYPRDCLEIILVDDESDDRTLEILEEFAKENSAVSVLSTADEPHSFPGKQRPLELGIRCAKGEILMVTDADCLVNPGWVKEHVSAYDGDTGIVGGLTVIETGSGNLFSRLMNCDQVSKLAVAMGCTGLGFPLTIMGNNMSFKRAAYDACGGYESIGTSIVEDVDLLYAVVRNTPYRAGWTRGKKSLVVSLPLKNFKSFIAQRRRMLRVKRGIPAIGKALLGMEILMTVLFAAALIFTFYDPRPLVILSFAWLFGYFHILLPLPADRLKNMLCVPVMLLFQAGYGILLGFYCLFGDRNVVWKGRKYDKVRSTKLEVRS